MAEVFRAGDALHHAVTQVYVRDVAEGDPELVGFQRGFVYTSEVDGTAYGILVPFINGAQYSGKVARVRFGNDDFRNDSSIHFAVNATGHRTLCDEADPRCLVKVLDLSAVDERLRGFVGGFVSGRHGYLVPFFDGISVGHLVAKVDLEDFTVASVQVLSLFNGGDQRHGGFFDGFAHGDYGYLVPSRSYFGPLNGTHTMYTADGFSGADTIFERSASAGDHLRVSATFSPARNAIVLRFSFALH